jgi:PRTRC genetic system protein C
MFCVEVCHFLRQKLSTILSTYKGGLKFIMTIETMVREFRYDEIRLPDPNPRLSVDEVRTAFSATYPEIATAALTGPEAVGNKLVYHFAKAIEIRGASAFFGGVLFQGFCV